MHFPFNKTNRAFVLSCFRDGTNLGNGHIPPTEKERFSTSELFQITGEVGLGLMNIQSNHDYNLNQKVN